MTPEPISKQAIGCFVLWILAGLGSCVFFAYVAIITLSQ